MQRGGNTVKEEGHKEEGQKEGQVTKKKVAGRKQIIWNYSQQHRSVIFNFIYFLGSLKV